MISDVLVVGGDRFDVLDATFHSIIVATLMF